MKILVADDDPQLVRALRITLAAHGYDVVAAADGAAAVALAAQSHPDIVCSTSGMPHLTASRSSRRCAAGRPRRSSSSRAARVRPTRSRRSMPEPTTT